MTDFPPPQQGEEWETTVQKAARQFEYPPTPDIAAAVRYRLNRPQRSTAYYWRLTAAVLIAVLIGLLSVPQVRAFVAEVLRIGAVRIFVTEPTPTAVPTLSATPNLLTSVLQLPGETTLEDAQEKSKFDLPLSPEYGAPDHVYYQQLGGSLVTLVWTKPEAPDEVLFSIQILNQNLVASKFYPFGVEEEVSVNDHRAYWLTRAHQLVYFYGERELRRMIDSNVLIWTIEPLTYRLETDLSLEETLKIAESLE